MIIEDLLLSYGADYKDYDTNDIIFAEGDKPSYYFQILKGKIKINNYNDQGKEFIQGIVSTGGSPVVSVLFTERSYPVNAIAFEDCRLLRLPKQHFFDLLKEKPDLYEKILSCISENMYYKYIMMQTMSFQNPENKLKTLMNYLKGHYENKSQYSYQIPFTRQQLASLTGLSVETVIRVTKSMEKNEVLKIKNRKIFY
ncbi:MAG: Crp/Fnr family transcriptional regulator [Chryseobacterium sp.]|jgi:CRP-like cAMP-binding protein|uniref:Crp/Fnr family transcriptional regulator n=1 Tax=Chryseobacterium sp. TaxID=1871047 RepID=UPI002627A20F|nr:Crp/Fnr family transcriptional regulator [Chryseobacterium sp.]MDF2552623.1 Crp/Fnr family transcriptional regulator [Chryseobacterium sp.]